jgi:hypothetical protein
MYSQMPKGKGDLIGYTDADFAGDIDDRRSTGGYVFVFAGGAVSWSSKKQTSVATSSTQAEYMAMTPAAKEALWFRRFFQEIEYYSTPHEPTKIYEDN